MGEREARLLGGSPSLVEKRTLADTVSRSSVVFQLVQENFIEERKRRSFKLQTQTLKKNRSPFRDASDPYLSSPLTETTEASSSIRNLRIASSVLPGAVAVRQGPRRPPLSRSAPPDRRRPLLLSRESGVHQKVLSIASGLHCITVLGIQVQNSVHL